MARSSPRVKRYEHPHAGRLDLSSSTFEVSGRPGARMTVYTPCDDATREALERLALQPVYRPWAAS